MSFDPHFPPIARPEAPPLEQRLAGVAVRGTGAALLLAVTLLWLSLVSWSVTDPSLTHATSGATRNLMGPLGAILSDLLLQTFGFATLVVLIAPLFWSIELLLSGRVQRFKIKLAFFPLAIAVLGGAVSALPVAVSWPLNHGYGGILGDAIYSLVVSILSVVNADRAGSAAGLLLFAGGFASLSHAIGVAFSDIVDAARSPQPQRDGGSVHGFEQQRPPVAIDARHASARHEPSFAPLGTFSRVLATARHTAQRGVAAFEASRANLNGRHQPQPTAHGDGYASGYAHGYGEGYQTDANAGEPAGYGDARRDYRDGYQQAPGMMQHPRAQYPGDAGLLPEPPPYVPPYPPAHGQQRMPIRGPAAALLAARPDAAPVQHDQRFDEATEQASRAMAARFAPGPAHVGHLPSAQSPTGHPAQEYMAAPATQPATASQGYAAPSAGSADAATAHVPAAATGYAAPGHSHAWLQTPRAAQANAQLRPQAPVAAPVPHSAPAPAASERQTLGAAVEPQRPVKRNALFGGLRFRHQDDPAFRRPPLHLLKKPVATKAGPELTQTMLRGNARLLEDVLADFGVKGEVRDIRPGPVVTLFEFEPARGTKSSRIIGLADDIARSMSVNAVRVAVVPGRNAIGIELPNARRDMVLLRELLEADTFKNAELALPVALGKAIGGEPIIADLARMPHLLVAGTTGSGKSVGVNAMILSLLYRLTPEECRFLMIDPKMLELSVYNGIPHLLTPVVTDPLKAVAALEWAVSEMEERYKRMAKLAVRNIDVFNNRVKNARKRGEMLARTVQTGFDRRTGEAIYEQEKLELEPMPYIVVVIDEFADLMLVAGKEVEAAVQRLAQMARAAGIHIIMATQRPSVDVITGTIKANFPTRISFKVTSKIDSRTILNDQGAEQLLGHGDMLYAVGSGQVMRVHGPFVADDEVEAIAKALRDNGPPDYISGIGEPAAPAVPEATDNRGQNEQDLYDRAVAIVLRDRKASTSYIQRRLSIGYNRAADLIERMEKEGVISPANAVGKRDILSSAGGPPGPADMDAA